MRQLDEDDIKMLKAFHSIPTNRRVGGWDRQVFLLQNKLAGVGDIDPDQTINNEKISDADWDQAIQYMKDYARKLVGANKKQEGKDLRELCLYFKKKYK